MTNVSKPTAIARLNFMLHAAYPSIGLQPPRMSPSLPPQIMLLPKVFGLHSRMEHGLAETVAADMEVGGYVVVGKGVGAM